MLAICEEEVPALAFPEPEQPFHFREADLNGPTHGVNPVGFKEVQSGVSGKECVPCPFPASFAEEDPDFPVGVFGIHVGIIAVQFAAVPDRLFLLQPVDDDGSVQVSRFGPVSGFPHL